MNVRNTEWTEDIGQGGKEEARWKEEKLKKKEDEGKENNTVSE